MAENAFHNVYAPELLEALGGPETPALIEAEAGSMAGRRFGTQGGGGGGWRRVLCVGRSSNAPDVEWNKKDEHVRVYLVCLYHLLVSSPENSGVASLLPKLLN